jgi:hypothetical protein
MASWDDSDPTLDNPAQPAAAGMHPPLRRSLTESSVQLKLAITHPELAPGLISALTQAQCIARRVASDTIEVLVPWDSDGRNEEQAVTELMFFVKAWAAIHPTFRATLIEAG